MPLLAVATQKGNRTQISFAYDAAETCLDAFALKHSMAHSIQMNISPWLSFSGVNLRVFNLRGAGRKSYPNRPRRRPGCRGDAPRGVVSPPFQAADSNFCLPEGSTSTILPPNGPRSDPKGLRETSPRSSPRMGWQPREGLPAL